MRKGFSANITHMRLLPCMYPLMNCQIKFRTYQLSTVFTWVFPLACRWHIWPLHPRQWMVIMLQGSIQICYFFTFTSRLWYIYIPLSCTWNIKSDQVRALNTISEWGYATILFLFHLQHVFVFHLQHDVFVLHLQRDVFVFHPKHDLPMFHLKMF